MAAACFARPAAWPLLLLPLLPLAGWMPWTGWLVVEELDLLLLSVAAGVYARWAWGWPTVVSAKPGRGVWYLLPLALSFAVALARGVTDAGGLSLGWWQGYQEPLNSVRLLKPMIAVLSLLPLWRAGLRRDAATAMRALQWGMVGLLAVVGACVLSERWAYTGLLEFSTDYRATGLFWEMHVGGAALDAVLVMGLPFVATLLLAARGSRAWACAAAVLVLGGYAALATFSRIVYLAAPLGLLLTWWLLRRQWGTAPAGATAGLGWVLGVGMAAAWLFPSSGYRGLLALLGAVVLMLPLAQLLRPLPPRAWGWGGLATLAGAAGVAALTWGVNKGAYLVYAVAWTATLMLMTVPRWRALASGAGLVAAFGVLLAGLVAVAVHWGGSAAWRASLTTALVLTLVLVAAAGSPRPIWPGSWRWQGQLVLAMMLVATVVGVFGGGDYMAQRLNGVADDGAGRRAHWRQSLSLLDNSDWLWGKGLGRFAANHALSGRAEDQVGDLRLAPAFGGAGQQLVLSSGKHMMGGGELLRLSQRVAALPAGPWRVQMDVHTEEPVIVHVELCQKHLLYPLGCVAKNQSLRPSSGHWQSLDLLLEGTVLDSGSWLAPRWIVFSVALDTAGRRVELDHLTLSDSRGQALLANGDFEQGLAHWFFSSDRHHMPWHAKNLFVHLLFEQGLLGLAAFVLVMGVALWRTSWGRASHHLLAPPLAAALLGLLTVGLVDSLLDMPRIAWLGLWLAAVALSLPLRPRGLSGGAGP